jgi:plasmid stabilization system protein ParE
MRQFVLTPRAKRDLEDIWDYIADRVLDALFSAMVKLTKTPGIGHRHVTKPLQIIRALHAARDVRNILRLTPDELAACGESRLAQKPGQPPYFAHREAPSNQCASEAKYGDCPRLLRFGPFCHGLLGHVLVTHKR